VHVVKDAPEASRNRTKTNRKGQLGSDVAPRTFFGTKVHAVAEIIFLGMDCRGINERPQGGSARKFPNFGTQKKKTFFFLLQIILKVFLSGLRHVFGILGGA
jgi:hypothetical protein